MLAGDLERREADIAGETGIDARMGSIRWMSVAVVDLPLVPVMAMTLRPSRIDFAPQIEVGGDGDAGFAGDGEDRP